jgi:hypothetical protein
MDPKWRTAYGLRPTLRQLMILVLFAAIVSSLTAPSLRGKSLWTNYLLISMVLITSPLVLAMLILFLDRPGPAKYWLVGLVASLSWPAYVLWLDWFFLSLGEWRNGWIICLVIINLFGLGSLFRIYRKLPKFCPACKEHALLPLGRARNRFYWCASCGSKGDQAKMADIRAKA